LSGSPSQWSTEECEAVADQVGRIFAGEIMRELIAMRKARAWTSCDIDGSASA